MGTSSIYKGPGGSNKLLPDWIQESDLSDKQKNEIAAEWKAAKATFTKAINSSKNSGNFSNKFLQHYSKAYGGSKGFIQSSKSFLTSFGLLHSFVYDLANKGINQTIRNLGDDFQGKNIKEILVIFSNECFPSGNTKEEAAVREAMVKTLELIYKEISQHKQINLLDSSVLNIILQNYISEYISARILSDLGSSFETSKINVPEVKTFETKVKDLIFSCVENKVKNIDFIKIDKGKIDISNLLGECVKELWGE